MQKLYINHILFEVRSICIFSNRLDHLSTKAFLLKVISIALLHATAIPGEKIQNQQKVFKKCHPKDGAKFENRTHSLMHLFIFCGIKTDKILK